MTGAQARWDASAYGDSAAAQSALVARLRIGFAGSRPTVLHARRHPQVLPGTPGLHRRHLAVGSASRSRAERDRRARWAAVHGVSENGTQLISHAVLGWCQDTRVDWHYIAPGKPQRNSFVESLGGRSCDECLTEHLFPSLVQQDGSSTHSGPTITSCVDPAALACWHPPSLRGARSKGTWTPKLRDHRPENGDHVTNSPPNVIDLVNGRPRPNADRLQNLIFTFSA